MIYSSFLQCSKHTKSESHWKAGGGGGGVQTGRPYERKPKSHFKWKTMSLIKWAEFPVSKANGVLIFPPEEYYSTADVFALWTKGFPR